MIIVNSSPIIHLTAALGGLDLLPGLYGRVLIPAEVLQELESGAARDDSAVRIRTLPGIEVWAPQPSIAPLLLSELDLGEAAVIALALDTPGATVILDDLAARRFAHRAGIPVTGSLGVLLDAKRAGRLVSVRDAIDRLRQHGAWLSDIVVERALRIAGEN